MKLKYLIVIGLLTLALAGCDVRAKIDKALPVDPTVVSSRTNSDNSRFTDYCATIVADIRNDGGNGEVVIEIAYSEGDKTWTKSKRETFTANETKTVSIDFPEATLGSDGKYSVTAR